MDQQLDMRGALGVMRRQVALIAGVALACLAAAVAVVLLVPPSYTATALVLVDPSRKDVLRPELQSGPTATDAARVESEVELARAEDTLLRVVDRLRLSNDPHFSARRGLVDTVLAALGWPSAMIATGDDARQAAVEILRRAVSIQRRGLTYLIAVEARAGDPAAAATLANAVAESYIELQLEAKVASALALHDAVGARLAAARRQVDGSQGGSEGGAMGPLGQEAALAQAQYLALLARLKDLEAQASLQVPDSRLASAARPPLTPSFPAPGLLLAAAVFGGLCLGLGLAYLRENVVGGFTSTEQLQAVLRPDAAVAVPRHRGMRPGLTSDTTGAADQVVAAPLSGFAETLRRARIDVDQLLGPPVPEQGAIIMVTSALPAEGKTTLAIALARTYALSGRSTLLIDGDLRRPSVHRHLDWDTSSGLFDYLAGGDYAPPLDAIITADPLSPARVIVGAHRSPIATDHLVTGMSFTRLIEAARANFDVVILDTPPIGPVVDGLHLAKLASVVVYVVRWAATSQQEARRSLDEIRRVIDPDIGVVALLNQEGRSARADRYAERYAGLAPEPSA